MACIKRSEGENLFPTRALARFPRVLESEKWHKLVAAWNGEEHCLGAAGAMYLAGQENRKLQRAHFSLTHATPLLPAPTLSEGEYRMSTR